MTTLFTHPAFALVLALAAAYAMVGAGIAKRRLAWRSARCSVCRRPRDHCVCKWQ
jgi:DTW domain-containing protein YfiP